MAYTAPKTWAYKETLSASDLNTYVRDNIIYLKTQVTTVPAVSLINSANISISTGTETRLTWDTELFDNDGMHSTVSNTGRITIVKAGLYLFNYKVKWQGLNATGRRFAQLWKNGSPVGGTSVEITPGAASYPDCSLSVLVDCAAADYFELDVYQTTGGAFNVLGGTSANAEICSFSAVRLGGLA